MFELSLLRHLQSFSRVRRALFGSALLFTFFAASRLIFRRSTIKTASVREDFESFHMDQPMMDTTGCDNAGGGCSGDGGGNIDPTAQTLYELVNSSAPEDELSVQCSSEMSSIYTANLNTLTNVALSLQYVNIDDNKLGMSQMTSIEDQNTVHAELQNYETLEPVSMKGEEIMSNGQLGVDHCGEQPSEVLEDLLEKDEIDSEDYLSTKKSQPSNNKGNWKGHTNRFTMQQRVFVLQQYWKNQRDYKAIKEAFMKRFDGAEPPTRSSIRNLNSKFEKEGTVIDRARSGRPTSVTSDQKIEEVRQYLTNNKKSTRVACKELKISKTSLLRIMKKVGFKQANEHDYSK